MRKYPDYIMSQVRQGLGLNENDTSEDENIIFEMSTNEVMDIVLKWNGIINHGCTIRSWVEDIYDIKLKNRA